MMSTFGFADKMITPPTVEVLWAQDTFGCVISETTVYNINQVDKQTNKKMAHTNTVLKFTWTKSSEK